EKHGSLTSAARELKMSYSQAYNLIKNIEEKLGFTLITSQTGE
ncbi:MAG: LysR family transcriptional regulator, partial [Bacillota bacterium]